MVNNSLHFIIIPEHSLHIPQESLKYHCSNCAKGFEYESLLKLHVDYEHNNQGGFQLLDLIIK